MPVSTINSAGRPADIRPGQDGQDTAALRRQGTPADSARAGRGSEAAAAKAPSLEENRQKAFQTIEQTLAMGYEKLAAKRGGGAGEFARFEPLSAEKVAGNILGFIERRLMSDAADGATQEQLQERLEQGLAGFKKGFAQAQEQLEALASFTPEIQTDINDTRDRVLSGIDDLRQRILDDQLEASEPADRADEAGSLNNQRGLQAYTYEQARASQFSFELTTAEGDRVSIQASSSAGASLSGSGEESSFSASASRSVSWSVEGELNDDERSAIESVLGGVDRLAEQFFAGDLDGAFDSAMALGYDREQVANFSLSLSQSSIQRVSETYAPAGPAAEAPGRSLGLQERLAPLGQFLRELESTLADAGQVSESPQTLLPEVAERMAGGSESSSAQAQSLRDFMASMLETLTTDPVSGISERRESDAGEASGEG